MTDTGSQVGQILLAWQCGHWHGRVVWAVQTGRDGAGSFVISTRSEQWDELAYYNPTNTSFNEIDNDFLFTNAINYYSLSIPQNAVAWVIQIVTNKFSPVPFPRICRFMCR